MISRAIGFVFVFCCYLASITSEAAHVELDAFGLPAKSKLERHVLQGFYWNGGKAVYDNDALDEPKMGMNKVIKELKKVKSDDIEAIMATVVALDEKEASHYKGDPYQKDLALLVKIKENSDKKQCTDDARSALALLKAISHHENGWVKNETHVDQVAFHYALENAQLCLGVYENNILEGLKSLDGDNVAKVEKVLSEELIDKYRSLNPDMDTAIFLTIKKEDMCSFDMRGLETFNLILKTLHEGEDSRDTLKRVNEDFAEPCKYYANTISPSMEAFYFAAEILSSSNKNFMSELPSELKNAIYRKEFCKKLPLMGFWAQSIKLGRSIYDK